MYCQPIIIIIIIIIIIFYFVTVLLSFLPSGRINVFITLLQLLISMSDPSRPTEKVCDPPTRSLDWLDPGL